MHIAEGKTSQFDVVYEIKQAPGCALYVEQDEENGDRTGKLSAANPQYRFDLKRKSPSDPWLVTDVNTKPGAQAPSGPVDLSAAARSRRSLYQPILLSSPAQI